MRGIKLLTIILALVGLLVAGCEKSIDPGTKTTVETPDDEMAALLASPLPNARGFVPSPLVIAQVGEDAVQFWPYTGTNFTDEPQDPINLIFFGSFAKLNPPDFPFLDEIILLSVKLCKIFETNSLGIFSFLAISSEVITSFSKWAARYKTAWSPYSHFLENITVIYNRIILSD